MITGGGGQLARELVGSKPEGIELFAPSHSDCDITNSNAVTAAFSDFRPDAVVNTAAYTNVDKAENENERAFLVNGTGPAIVASACQKSNARLVQISTDYVFDGARSTPYPVTAAPRPLSVYGASKLLGEQEVSRISERSVVLRCGWLYSRVPGNAVTRLLDAMRKGIPLRVVSDQVAVPTATSEVARAIWWCVSKPSAARILHWASSGSASRYEFAVALRDLADSCGLLDTPVPLTAVTSAEYGAAAKRPAYSALDATVTWRAMGWTPPDWRLTLSEMVRAIAGEPSRSP
jgi:dTDP-4-dehydrorhamnose reductase